MNIRKLTLTLSLGMIMVLKVHFGHGQEIDPERMNKDLKVAETIMESLVEDKNQLLVLDRQHPHLKQMRVNKGGIRILSSPNWPSSPSSAGSQYLGGLGVIIRFDAEKGIMGKFSFMKQPSNVSMKQPSNVRIATGMGIFGNQGADFAEIEGPDIRVGQPPNQEGAGDDREKVKNSMITYLLDYADLIGQLKPEDKIMLVEKPGQPFHLLQKDQEFEDDGKSWNAVITKKDLNSYKSGEISRSEAVEKIHFTEVQPSRELAMDVVMLVNIMERLYAPDISSTYYLQRKSSVEYISNFGVVYHFDFYSSIRINEDNFDMPTLGLTGLTQTERDEKVKLLYLQFLTDIEQQFITYGKTVKSLQPEETLMFRIKLTPCKDCGIPDQLEISAQSKDFRDFDQGKISEKQMLNLLTVIEKSDDE